MPITSVGAGTATEAANADVDASVHASMAEFDLILAFTAINNSGTSATIDAVGGGTYSQIHAAISDRFRTWGKIAGAGEDTTPLVDITPGTGGLLITSTFTLRGILQDTIANILDAAPAESLNGSAQNIAYPAYTVVHDNCAVILGVYKEDDWTSIDPDAQIDSNFTLIQEFSSTTGNDGAMAWWQWIQGTKTNITSGTITVTGGAAAVSRAVVFAIQPAVAGALIWPQFFRPRKPLLRM